MTRSKDRDLGMDRSITRRDFLNGMSVAVTGSLVGSAWVDAFGQPAPAGFYPEKAPDYYPPALTGLRGSHDGAFEMAHQLRDGMPMGEPGPEADTGEVYDLVIVGGGISGLAAAYFYRKEAGPQARILVLDNHEDFGGHAVRNEFTSTHGGRTIIGYGGTQSIDTPSSYSPEAMGLMRELGIDVDRFYKYFDRDLYSSLDLDRGIFFDKETFGADQLVVKGKLSWKEFAARSPLNEVAQKDLVRLYEDKKDYIPGLTRDEKKARLRKMSYLDFLEDYVKVGPQILAYFQSRSNSLFGRGIDALPASSGWRIGYPGFDGMDLMENKSETPGRSEPYIFHFPDGCASISRLLVRAMIPESVPGETMEDIVTARLNYAQLDENERPVRIRLNSTAIRARHLGDTSSAKEVEVTYIRGGKMQRVRGRSCVLACWNSVIPHLCPEMSEKQKKALAYGVKVPLVYTNVLLRNWTSFQKLGISSVTCPGGYHHSLSLDFPVSMGEYKFSASPEEPIVVHLVKVPGRPGLPLREQYRMGRYELLATKFEKYERETRDLLNRILQPGGFDPARDIEAITVNRWPHGYAYEYNAIDEPDWKEEDKPCVVGRQPFGRISIANSDAAGDAYVNPAVDQAHRAVQEVLARGPATNG